MLLVASALGALFFVWIVGLRLISPTEYEWVMKLDWRIHFLGWHLFRGEPWHWPPGYLESYYHAPYGTSIGYTDSIPLAAFALKPFEAWLPMPFQYLGIWLLACFGLQGVFGVLLVRLWSASCFVQLFGAQLFVMMPTLLNRVLHPALCAHWTLLWALWIYFRWKPADAVPIGHMLALTFLVGLIHPYLAVMVLAVLAAFTVRVLWSRVVNRRAALAGYGGSATLVVAAWWAGGLFLVTPDSTARPGLTVFSMNLLGPVTPSGWSSLLPPINVGAPGQPFEGFQYLGIGMLGLLVLAAVWSFKEWPGVLRPTLGPIAATALLLALYALSPRVTLADTVVFDASSPRLDSLAVFGVTGRFFWVSSYVLATLSIAVVVRRARPATAAVILAAACIVQFVDLRPAYAERRAVARSDMFHTWTGRLGSPTWAAALPHYDHIVLYYPQQCGGVPVTFEGPAFLAGFYGVTVNVGEIARANESDRAAYCAALDAQLSSGQVRDHELYLVHRSLEALIRERAPHLRCGDIDNLRVCVTDASYKKWSDAAALEW